MLTPATLPQRLHRRLVRHRRWLSLGAAAMALLAAWAASHPASRVGVPVLVASTELSAGEVVRPEHLETVRVPRVVAPDPVLDTEDVVGRPISLSMRRGEIFTTQRLLGEDLLARFPGHDAVSLPVPANRVPWTLEVGTPVVLVVVDPDSGTASPGVDAVVLRLHDDQGPLSDETSVTLTCAVASGNVDKLLADASRGLVNVTLRG